MGQILSIKDLNKTPKLKKADEKLVLVGGCFDILHSGHIYFLEQAKSKGDVLLVLLESDQRIRELKGRGRPINTQEERAKILSNLSMVDVVVPLRNIQNSKDWQALVKKIQPDIIAVTNQDQVYSWEKDYKISVIKRKSDLSTTKIIDRISRKITK